MRGKPTPPQWGANCPDLGVETGNNFQEPGVPVGAGLHLLCSERFKIHEGGGVVFNLINAELCPEGIPAPQGSVWGLVVHIVTSGLTGRKCLALLLLLFPAILHKRDGKLPIPTINQTHTIFHKCTSLFFFLIKTPQTSQPSSTDAVVTKNFY